MFIRNGQKFNINVPHLIGDTQYPVGWFFDADNRAASDVLEVADDAETAAANQAAYVAGVIANVTSGTQQRLDDFARTRNYDGILSACTYASSGVPKFAGEGQYCVDARDSTWATLYTFMAEVQLGTKPMPTGYADVEPLLPALAWPV